MSETMSETMSENRMENTGATAPHAQKASAKPKLSPAKRRRRVRRILKAIAWVLILCALAAAGWWYYNTTIKKTEESDAVQYTRAMVQQGEFDVHVYGSGAIAAASQPIVYMETDGKLADIRVAVGDSVSKGQILAVLQNDALNDEITSLEYDLWSADSTITSTSAGSEVASIAAPSEGRIMQISANVGDDALAVYRRLGSVAMLSTDGRMKIELDVAEDVTLSYGDIVTVTGEGFEREGNVTDVFMQGTRAVVTVVDDTLPMDAPVTVTTKEGTAVGAGTLEINKPMAVSAFGGTITKVRQKVGDTVYRKQEMFLLEDSPITLKVENLRIQRETAAESLEDAREKRENLIVRSPVDGVIATVDAAEGSDITAGTALCSILEGEDMVLTIAVDELDVVQVAEGQPVTISVDALPNLMLSGQVQKIAPVGTSSSGVSTYDVKLSFDSAGTGVRPGMNASGEVQVAHADSALYVPVEALMTIGDQKYVMVADGAQSPTGSVGDGTMQFQGFPGGAIGEQGMPTLDQTTFNSADAPSFQGAPGEGQGTVTNDSARGSQGTQGAQGDRGTGRNRDTQRNGQATEGQTNMQFGGGGANGNPTFRRENNGSGAQTNASAQNTATTGTLRLVSVGLINDDYAEILSGVNAGEIVLYQSASTSSTNQFNMRNSNMAMPMMGF